MSVWTHSICDGCWVKRCAERGEPARQPYRVKGATDVPGDPCCFCGGPVSPADGMIFVRDTPGQQFCGGHS